MSMDPISTKAIIKDSGRAIEVWAYGMRWTVRPSISWPGAWIAYPHDASLSPALGETIYGAVQRSAEYRASAAAKEN